MTKNQKNLKRTGIITGTFLAVALTGYAGTPNNANDANSSLLDFDVLGTGTEIMADVSTLNGNMNRTLELKCGEGKCGEGKCGEGKCGAETKEKAESAKKETAKKATAKEAKAKRKASKKAKKVKKTEVGF